MFTYGWERSEVGIPPGSTTVEIDLSRRPDGGTTVRLVHSGLGEAAADAHQGGWAHYLDRLRRTAEGEHVGRDPWAHRRVPHPRSWPSMTAPDDAEERFWAVAEPFLAMPDVSRSTMMGLPCLRRTGAFFASYDRRSGNLVVKLPEPVSPSSSRRRRARRSRRPGGVSASGPPSHRRPTRRG